MAPWSCCASSGLDEKSESGHGRRLSMGTEIENLQVFNAFFVKANFNLKNLNCKMLWSLK